MTTKTADYAKGVSETASEVLGHMKAVMAENSRALDAATTTTRDSRSRIPPEYFRLRKNGCHGCGAIM